MKLPGSSAVRDEGLGRAGARLVSPGQTELRSGAELMAGIPVSAESPGVESESQGKSQKRVAEKGEPKMETYRCRCSAWIE